MSADVGITTKLLLALLAEAVNDLLQEITGVSDS